MRQLQILAFIAVFVLVLGCTGPQIYAQVVARAHEVCEPHRGLRTLEASQAYKEATASMTLYQRAKAYCVDGVAVEFTVSGIR